MEKKTWITGRFVFYIFLLVLALVFTQALRSSASAVLFIFLLILPIISFIITLIGKSAVKVYVDSDNTRVEKDTDVSYEIRIINDSFIPYPFVEAHIIVPSESGVRCVEQRMMIPLVPFGVRTVKYSVRFHYRGEYEIGVLDMRIKDPLGLFSVSLEQSVCRTVIVYPRMMNLSSPIENSTTELPTDLTRRAISSERSEQANIRAYVGGDSLKDIHWKLSSKMEELLVRDYNTNDTRNTFIIADLNALDTGAAKEQSAAKPKSEKSGAKKKMRSKKKARKVAELPAAVISEDAKKLLTESAEKSFSSEKKEFAKEIAESAANAVDLKLAPKKRLYPEIRPELADEISELNCDRVVELAIAAALRELRSGSSVTLLYNDMREKSGVVSRSYPDTQSFAAECLDFACAPVSFGGRGLAPLFSAVEGTQNLNVRIITSNLSPKAVSEYSAFSASCGGGGSDTNVELYFVDDTYAYTDPTERGVYVSAMCSELAASAVKVSVFEESAMQDGTVSFVRGEV